MIRGTTPTLRIKIKSDIDLEQMKDIWVTVKNNIFEVTYKLSNNQIDIEKEEKRLLIKMSQEDTLNFSAGKVKIQVRFLDSMDTAFATKIAERDIGAVLKEGIIHD